MAGDGACKRRNKPIVARGKEVGKLLKKIKGSKGYKLPVTGCSAQHREYS